MAKKAQKRSPIPSKDNAGCLRSFVSIFEFSHSYNLCRSLADRKWRSASNSGTSFLGNNLLEDTRERKYEHDANADGCEETIVLSRLPSVKTLIEEEMSKERTSKASPCHIKPKRKMTKSHKNDSDPRINNFLDSAYVVLEQIKCREQAEGSNLIFDLAALMVEFCSASRNCSDIYEENETDLCGSLSSSGHRKHFQLACKHSMLQEDLVIEAEAFLSQKIDDTKRLVGNGVIHSQEFMDALEILNSNKELFLKLVQDPNSLVFSHIQELFKPQVADFSKLEAGDCLEGNDHLEEKLRNSDQNRKYISTQILQKQKQHFFSIKKGKFPGEIASKIRNTSKEMSKIVVLKPHLTRNLDCSTRNSTCSTSQSCYSKKNEKDSERTVSHFSFKEIKRKLSYMIGDRRKEQHLISKDSFSRIPFGYKGSADTDIMNSTESTKNNSKEDKKPMAKEWQQKVSLVHAECFNEEEADKHFSEMISTEYRTTNSNINQISKSLEKMFSPSDFNQLKLQLIDDTSANLSREQSLKETPCLSGELDVEMPVINTEAANDKVRLQEETCKEEQPKTQGREEIVEIENVKSLHINPAKECNTLHIPDGSSCKDRCSTPSEQGTPNEKPRILIPTAAIAQSSLINNHFESSELIEKPERPSPVSVLEPFFLEGDDASPDRPNIKLDELHKPLQPIHLSFHDSSAMIIPSDCLITHQTSCSYDMEMMTKYARIMHEAYSFDSEMSPERWLSLDEIKSLQGSYPDDPKLLQDCVNEVLSDMKYRRFRFFSWLSFLKPTVQPILKDFIIEEICKTVMSYLSSQVQSTINEMMSKDMDSAMWMDHRLEMECIVAEMGCNIFEELMEETIFELYFLLKL